MKLSQIEYCAQECAKQEAGELAVYHMCNAFAWLKHETTLTFETIGTLGMLVDPNKNWSSFRTFPVRFADFTFAIPHDNIQHALQTLIENQFVLTPAEFYQEFESIHPFVDGNGRVGALLYVFLTDSFANPQTPPEYQKG